MKAAFGAPGVLFSASASRFFDGEIEVVHAGNAGLELVRGWLGGFAKDGHSAAACVLRAALRPSVIALERAAALLPWGGGTGGARPRYLVGVHVRAARYLRDDDAYGGSVDISISAR